MRLPIRRRSAHAGAADSARETSPTSVPGSPTGPTPAPPSTNQAAKTPEDRIGGLGAWLLQVDRRLSVRTYVGAATIFLALAAAVVALVIALNVRGNSATKGDVQSLRDQISAVDRSATQAARRQVHLLDLRLRRQRAQLSHLSSAQRTAKGQLATAEGHIDSLRRQISSLQSTASPSVGSGQGGGSSAGGTSAGNAHSTLNVSETEYRLAPARPTVNAGTVKIVATNDGKIPHSLAVQGPTGTEQLQKHLAPGASGTLTLSLQQAGTYQWYCPIAGHKGLGMKGTITVK